MVTSSHTRNPPVSRAVFHVNPKSFRLIFVVADMPIRVLPHGSVAGAVGPSTANATLRVTPRMARFPSTVSSPSPLGLTRVELNDKIGNVCTSKKSALLRCASRSGLWVLIEPTSIEAPTCDLVTSYSSSEITPLMAENCPLTLLIIMCLTLNSAVEWTGSMFQVVVGAAIAFAALISVTPFQLDLIRLNDIRCNKFGGRGSDRSAPAER